MVETPLSTTNADGRRTLTAPRKARLRNAQWLEDVTRMINVDTELQIIGRHFTATVSFTFGSDRCDFVIEQGKVVGMRHGKKIDHRADFGFRASDETWDRFFQDPPPPLYNSVFAMLMRVDDFRLDGDGLVLAQNARALTRFLNIMQAEGAVK
jgi:hypothetical protein